MTIHTTLYLVVKLVDGRGVRVTATAVVVVVAVDLPSGDQLLEMNHESLPVGRRCEVIYVEYLVVL